MRLARLRVKAMGLLRSMGVTPMGHRSCEAGVPPATPDVRTRVDAIAAELKAHASTERRSLWWRIAGARGLVARNRHAEAKTVAAGTKPAGGSTMNAGDLGMILEQTADGIALVGLYDSGVDADLVVAAGCPLFRIVFREISGPGKVELTADRVGRTPRSRRGHPSAGDRRSTAVSATSRSRHDLRPTLRLRRSAGCSP